MNFELNEDQILFRDSVERYLQENYSFDQRVGVIQSGEPFSLETWAQAAELGWLAFPFAESQGGFGGSAVDLMVLFEQLGRALSLEPFLETVVLAGGLLGRLGSDKDTGVAALIRGEQHLAFAHQEPKAFALNRVETIAQTCAEGYEISGEKAAIYNVPAAQQLIVTAMLDGELAVFVVPADTDGLSVSPFSTIDERQAADLIFESVKVDNTNLLAVGEQAHKALQEVIDDALVCVAAEQLGMMKAVLDITVDYTKERHQFGVPLSSFQVLQHRMVDMYIAIEMTTSLLYAAAIKVRDRTEDASMFASAAKLKADSCAKQVCFSGFQLHGGIATTNEYPVGHYLKRNTVLDSFFGGRGYQLERYKQLNVHRDVA